MLICRFCLGVLFGLTMPISMVVVSEIVPLQYRGKFVVLLQLIYALGVLYMIGCCGIFLIDYTHGDWRTLLLVNSIPPLLCFLGSIYYLHESPRYYVDTANFHRAFLGINVMI